MQTIRPTLRKMYRSDVPKSFVDLAFDASTIAWDIETSGLDWRNDKIAICQIYIPKGPVALVKVDDDYPHLLMSLLANASIQKVFHHAMFDLRFMVHKWGVTPQNIACTKIASKILDRSLEKHSLQALLERHLNIRVDKTQQSSNWMSPSLTEEQKAYAISDVVYLPMLLRSLENKLALKGGLLDLTYSCYKHIPTRVWLDIHDYDDIYLY